MRELLDHGAKTVILGIGFYERLEVQPETLRMLEEKGVNVYVLQSEEAAQLYSKLMRKWEAGAAIHTTC